MDSYLKQETQVENNMETENSAGLKRKLSTTSKISTEAVGTGEATNAKRRKSSRASGTSGTVKEYLFFQFFSGLLRFLKVFKKNSTIM
jgi:hypothetical protein